MDSCDSLPPAELQPDQVSSCSTEERKMILNTYTHAIVQTFTNLQLQMEPFAPKVIYDDKIIGYAIEPMTLGLFY